MIAADPVEQAKENAWKEYRRRAMRDGPLLVGTKRAFFAGFDAAVSAAAAAIKGKDKP
jgi:hypothetical protein